jgi:branched-chain amino acid transport system permease protein
MSPGASRAGRRAALNGGGRKRRAMALLLLLALLAGCAAAERRIAACRAAFALLAPGVTVETAAATGDAVAIEGAGRRLLCGFGADTPAGPALLAAALDGAPLSPVRLALLHQALRLPTPAELLAPASAPPPPAARLAFALQQLVNGLSIGAVLGLVAIGYALVYAVTGTIQFAYGELYMLGAVLVAGFALALPSLALTILLAVLLTAGYGWAADRLVWRPLREAGRLPALIAAIGLAIALREYVRLGQGSGNKWLPPFLPGSWRLWSGGGFDVLVGAAQLVALGLAAGLAAGLGWALARTRLGRAWRACADDSEAAALIGVDVERTIAAAFVAGAALAAVAGAMVAVQYGEADFSMGYLMGFKALTAALLGGFGSVPGAFVGALLIGLLEAGWSAAFGLAWKDAAVFGVLILVLIFRPQGLFPGRAASRAQGLPAPR